jgi:Restriction endonuclease
MITIDLNYPELFVKNADPSTRVVMTESIILSFASSGHRSGVKLKVFNTKGPIEEVKFTWTAGKGYGKNLPPDRSRLHRQAAVAIGFLLAEKVAGYEYAAHSASESVVDYWLKKEDPGTLSQSLSTLLQTGVLPQGSTAAMTERLMGIKRQREGLTGQGIPLLVGVVELSEPKVLFEFYPVPATYLESCRITLDELNEALIHHLAAHPEKLYDLSPRKYEELVAELLRVMGYDVYLTRQTRDGGRDIVAVLKGPTGGKLLTLVECKRNRMDRPVGIDVVQRFMWTTKNEFRANVGMLATTSYFTKDATEFQKRYKWDLNLHDFQNIKDWLNDYGQWVQSDEDHGIWLPSDPSL